MRTARRGQLGSRGSRERTCGEFKFTRGLDCEEIEEWRCWLYGADGASVVGGKPKRPCKRAVIAQKHHKGSHTCIERICGRTGGPRGRQPNGGEPWGPSACGVLGAALDERDDWGPDMRKLGGRTGHVEMAADYTSRGCAREAGPIMAGGRVVIEAHGGCGRRGIVVDRGGLRRWVVVRVVGGGQALFKILPVI